MKIGTRSVLFGVHQFLLHPYFVLRAWRVLYHEWPKLHEFLAIVTHDLGYWGLPNMDGVEGEKHPAIAARWWSKNYLGKSFRSDVAREIIGHSRFYSKKTGIPLSKLFRADKLSVAFYPRWLYLLLGALSGEINEYMEHSRKGKYEDLLNGSTTKTRWLLEVQAHMILMGLYGISHIEVSEKSKNKLR